MVRTHQPMKNFGHILLHKIFTPIFSFWNFILKGPEVLKKHIGSKNCIENEGSEAKTSDVKSFSQNKENPKKNFKPSKSFRNGKSTAKQTPEI